MFADYEKTVIYEFRKSLNYLHDSMIIGFLSFID